MNRPRVIQVERHVAHACNFSCVSCSHFSQEGHTGRDTVESFVREVGPWAPRLFPQYVLILGGEPCMNPDLCDILVEARKLWPERGTEGVRILLVTNGWLLHKHPRLPDVLRANDIRLDLSVHNDHPTYRAQFGTILNLVRSWGITPHFRESYRKWTAIYHGSGKDVLPFTDGNPQQSWERCVSHWCLQLHEGRLWKCPPVAYLPMQHRKYGLDERAWAQFLSYKALEPTCSDSELTEFVQRKCESICGQCPANPVPFRKPLPLRGVTP